MLSFSPLKVATTHLLLFSLSCTLSYAAIGDLTIEVIGRTGDPTTGPNSIPIESITYGKFGGGAHPVSIDDLGNVTFSATIGSGQSTASGIYQYTSALTPSVIAQSGASAPGVTFGGDPGEMKSVPWRGYTSSPNGLRHNFSTYVFSGTDEFMFLVNEGVIDTSPLIYPDSIGESTQPHGQFTISDGRGTSIELPLGPSDSMSLSNDGMFVWKGGFHIFRGTSSSDITAVAFQDSPAPGFEESENASFVSNLHLRGIDAFNRVYFTTRVTGQSFTNQETIYRLAADSAELTLLYAKSEHILPGFTENTNSQFEADDVYPLENGTVILRAGTGSVTGFWRIKPDGSIEQAALFSEFTPTSTDQGDVGFRSLRVDFSDYAVSSDGSIFFTGDVRFGASGTNQEGVWMIDPDDNSIKTIARAPLNGSFGDAPGTDETYFNFSHLTADGDGNIAFISELSNGKSGLFATKRNGTVIAIAIEGDPLDGSTINTIHFTPDHAGQDLSDSQGASGINRFGDIVFTAELANNTTAIVRASYEKPPIPKGNKYTWDGGIASTSWMEIDSNQTNWVDADGVRWDFPPNNANAEVSIPANEVVTLQTGNVQVKDLQASGSLELLSRLTVNDDANFDDIDIAANGGLTTHGPTAFDGELTSAAKGIEFEPNTGSSYLHAAGSLSSVDEAIFANGSHVLDISNQATLASSGATALYAHSTQNNILITNSENISGTGGRGIEANAPNGAVTIESPPPNETATPTISSGNGTGILVNAKNDSSISIQGDITSVGDGNDFHAAGISVSTTSGKGTIQSKGIVSMSSSAPTVFGISLETNSDATLTHEGVISSTAGSILAISANGNVQVDASKAILGGSLQTSSANGTTTIQVAQLDAASADGLGATAGGDIQITATGPINAIDAQHAISATSTGGQIHIQSDASITTFGSSNPGIGIFTQAFGDINITQNAALNLSSGGILARSSNGHIFIDAKSSYISAENVGIDGNASAGNLTLKSGELAIANGSGVYAVAHGTIDIDHNGEINTLSGVTPDTGSYGVYAESTTANVTISSIGNIDTFHDGPAPAFFATAQTDIDIQSTGNLSTFKSPVIRATSTAGNITLDIKGDLAATDRGEGIVAETQSGSININFASGSIESRGDGQGDGVRAEADQSISIVSSGNIQSIGTDAPGIHAASSSAGVSIVTHSDISALGDDSTGIDLFSPTKQTLTIVNGTIEGAEGDASGVRFNEGNDNKLTNHGNVASLGLVAVRGSTGDETIENFGTIYGDILLGSGANSLTNHKDAFLYPETEIDLGASNLLMNSGQLILGNDPASATALSLKGDLQQDGSGSLNFDVPSALTNDALSITGGAQLAGSLLLQFDQSIELNAPLVASLLTANALNGTFDSQLISSAEGLEPAEALAHAKRHPSRSASLSIEYTVTEVIATVAKLEINNYDDWKNAFINAPASTESSISNPLADDDLAEDPDDDGLTNLEEYVFGTHPLISTDSPVSIHSETDADSSSVTTNLSFTWAKDVADYEWELQKSSDLENWTPLNIAPDSTHDLGELNRYSFIYQSPSQQEFIRILISPTSSN